MSWLCLCRIKRGSDNCQKIKISNSFCLIETDRKPFFKLTMGRLRKNSTIFAVFPRSGKWTTGYMLQTRANQMNDHLTPELVITRQTPPFSKHRQPRLFSKHQPMVRHPSASIVDPEGWTVNMVRGATVHKAGSKIPTWLDVSPVYTVW